jgi:transcriptional regulator with PAS, ATPase and Fis domain
MAALMADADATVLIGGETGTGKGVLASWIHANSRRGGEAFVDINCAGLSRELLESELFGHERGAFTGALAAKAGLFEIAHRGTTFLDEIGDIDLEVQPKLLKVLEERRFRRVGDVTDRSVDVRLITATHRDLPVLARQNRFRMDLLFRINTLSLHLPALRERAEDVPILAEAILGRLAAQVGRKELVMTRDAIAALQSYHWPGNIRELRNVLERAVLLMKGTEITAAHLHFDMANQSLDSGNDDEPLLTLAEMERRHILRVLEAERFNIDRAAKRLDVPRSTLYRRVKELDLMPTR